MAPTHRREQTSTPTEREWGTTSLVDIYRKDTPGQTDDADEDKIDEDLRDWFGKGKSGGVGGGGWDRYNSKGERIGKCGDAEDRGGAGEGKPKCLSKQKAAQLRAKGGKQAIANAVSRKKSQDSVTDRPGTGNAPRPVSNRIGEDVLSEKNVPTNPGLWSRAKSAAKSKFDVYPSAYANGWAAKWYKSKGGGWKTEETESVTEAYLTELGNRPYPFRNTIHEPHAHMQSVFEIPEIGKVYKVSMWVTKRSTSNVRRGLPSPPSRPTEWEFGFGQHDIKDADWTSPTPGIDTIIGRTGIEIPVFATVLAILKQFVNEVHPEKIVYTAKDPSRQRLYARFTKLAQRFIPGYTGREVSPGQYEIQSNDTLKEHIVKIDGKYRLVSKTSGKNLGTYDTKAGAEQREREVQYFKQHEDTMSRIPSFKQHVREFSGDTVTEALTQPHGQLHDQVKAAFTKIVPVHQIYAIAAICEYLASQPLYSRQKAFFLAIGKRLEELHDDVNARENPANEFPHPRRFSVRSQYLLMIQQITIMKVPFAKMAPKDQIDAIVEMCKHLISTPLYSPQKPDLRDIIGYLEKLHSFVDHLGAGASGGRVH